MNSHQEESTRNGTFFKDDEYDDMKMEKRNVAAKFSTSIYLETVNDQLFGKQLLKRTQLKKS